MSYDVRVGSVWTNHTSNTADMMEAACGSWPELWNGMLATDVLPILNKAILELTSNPSKYKKYEDKNRWGTIESTIKFLKEIRTGCEESPDDIVEVDY